MKRLIGTALLALLFLSSGAHAQAPLQRGGDVRLVNERGRAETVRLYEESYALVIGASDYKYWPRLSGPRDDVPAVRAILERHGFKVEELSEPTGDVLLSRINTFINDHGLYPDNRLLIYFSGHGYTEVSGDGRKFGYVVPVDAPKPSKDLIGFQQKALTMDEIEMAARKIRSKHALFVFDSCFSGTLVNKGDVRVPAIIDYYATQPVRQFITAGADNQEVPNVSVFRKVFVRGLEGEANANGDQYITGTELATYLQEKVAAYSRGTQTPLYGKIRDPSLDRGDFIFILPNAPPPAAADNNAQALAAQAMTKMMRGEFDEASRLANQSLSLDNSVALAYLVRGHSLFKSDKEEEGLADLETANRLDKRSGVLRALLSADYWNARRTELSKTAAEEALRLLVSPNDDIDFYARGVAHEVAGDYDAAIADYDKAVGLNPQNFSAYSSRARAFQGKGDYARAIAEFTKLIESRRPDYDLYNNRGVAHAAKGDYDPAVADYDRAIELNPRFAIAYSNCGLAYYNKGDYDRAISYYDKAIGLKPRNAEYHYNRGLAYQVKGNRVRAVDDYSEAIRLNANYVSAYWARAKSYERLGEAAKAQADREKAAELEKSAAKH